MSSDAAPTLQPRPDEEPTHRERLAALIDARLDIPMAVLALVWALLVAYELVAPRERADELTLAGNIIWGIFVVEFVAKLVVSGKPLRFMRRNWPSVLFLVLPALRMLRVVRAVRALRVLPAARVLGSSYRAVGTASALLQGRLAFLVAASAIAIFGGGQLLYLLERGQPTGTASLGDALWWAANLAIGANVVFDPTTLLGRLITIVLSAYSVVVFAAVAGALGAFFIESRAERATLEDTDDPGERDGDDPAARPGDEESDDGDARGGGGGR